MQARQRLISQERGGPGRSGSKQYSGIRRNGPTTGPSMGLQGFGAGAAGIPKAPVAQPSVFNGRPGIFDQNKRQRVPSASRQGAEGALDDARSVTKESDEVKRLRARIEELEKVAKTKDAIIERQRAEITSLRKKNFDARARALELEDKYKESKEQLGQQKKERDNRRRPHQPVTDEAAELAAAMHMQRAAMRDREQQEMMAAIAMSMAGGGDEEERMLQRAIEESKVPDDPSNPNPDNMTYEQLMALEERNGKVSKGLTPAQINSIRERAWMRAGDTQEETCSICFDVFEKFQKYKKLAKCGHEYHSKCINTWLEDQKRCPMCNEDVV